MMCTSEERREVAARLRESVHAGRYLDESIADAILLTMNVSEVYRRPIGSILADLIDPTCHIADDDWASRQCMGPMISCDRCGKAFPEINGPYQYCPYCGARVVDEDGD